jgi:hypothetical protein
VRHYKFRSAAAPAHFGRRGGRYSVGLLLKVTRLGWADCVAEFGGMQRCGGALCGRKQRATFWAPVRQALVDWVLRRTPFPGETFPSGK